LGIAFFSLMDTSGSYKNSPKISMIEDEHAKRTPAPDAIRKKIERIGLKVVLQKRARYVRSFPLICKRILVHGTPSSHKSVV